MELNDITEIFRKKEGKPTKINPQEAIDILGYLMIYKGIEEIVAKYKLDLFKYPLSGYGKEPIEELINVIKIHLYDGTGNVQYDKEKFTINLECPPGKVFGIFICRDKMEIIIGKKLIDDE